jgi:glutamate/tyrosine decarboxylase-like PLP-dependent enzyme
MVERCCALAARMAGAIAAEPGAALVCPVVLNQFMIRFGGDGAEGDRLTAETLQAVQDDAVAFIGGAEWRGRRVMRVSVTSASTTEAAADETVASVLRAWRGVGEAGR